MVKVCELCDNICDFVVKVCECAKTICKLCGRICEYVMNVCEFVVTFVNLW